MADKSSANIHFAEFPFRPFLSFAGTNAAARKEEAEGKLEAARTG